MKHARLGTLDVGRIGLGRWRCPTPTREPGPRKGSRSGRSIARSILVSRSSTPQNEAAAALAALLRSRGFEKVTVVFEEPPAT